LLRLPEQCWGLFWILCSTDPAAGAAGAVFNDTHVRLTESATLTTTQKLTPVKLVTSQTNSERKPPFLVPDQWAVQWLWTPALEETTHRRTG